MKKSLTKLLFIFSLISLFITGCSKKACEVNENLIGERVRDCFYTRIVNNLSDEKDSFFVPQNLKTELNRYCIKDGLFYTTFELLFPDKYNQNNTFNFYDLYNDDCSWVDNLLIELEEEKIADQLLKMENHFEEVSELVDEAEEISEAEKIKEEITKTEKNEVMSASRKLGFMEYGDEKFIPQKVGNNYILIQSYEDDVSRAFYDDLFRCTRVENWKISDSEEKLVSLTETRYKENTYIPEIIVTSTDKSKNYQVFNVKGQLVEEKTYDLFENKEYEKQTLRLKYNNDKIVESVSTEYNYTDNDYSKLSYTFVKKYIYKYNNDDIPADLDYYENDILKLKRKYFSQDTYKTWIYFDEGYSVFTEYQNNKPVREVFSVNDRVVREKIYEK